MDYIVTTPCGPIQGAPGRLPGTVAYKGIRYATAGRWEYPTPVTAWEGIYDATRYGHCAYQSRAFHSEADDPQASFYFNEFRKGTSYTYSEDCLFLNIFTPDGATAQDKYPVLVYIHGGGFTGGCGHEKHFDGPVWPNKGVIGVTINYRLGPLGFLCLPELKQEAGITGNYGLFDQLAALQWVHDNIAAFGGDPGNVTIMGQSAGAMSVQQHVLSPLGEGLYHKAVMSSGGGVSRLMSAAAPESQYDFWHAVMEKADCSDLAEFRDLSVERLFECWQDCKKEKIKGSATATSPVVDGRLVVGAGADLLAKNMHKKIPYMAGSTSEDMMPPVIYQMAKDWCAAQEVKSYTWFFDRKLPGDDAGAWHSSDLWYWFGTLENGWRPWQRKDHKLSNQMTDYLTNFCKYGDPNGTKLVGWLPSSKRQRNVLRLGEEDTRMGSVNLLKLTKTMLTNKSGGER